MFIEEKNFDGIVVNIVHTSLNELNDIKNDFMENLKYKFKIECHIMRVNNVLDYRFDSYKSLSIGGASIHYFTDTDPHLSSEIVKIYDKFAKNKKLSDINRTLMGTFNYRNSNLLVHKKKYYCIVVDDSIDENDPLILNNIEAAVISTCSMDQNFRNPILYNTDRTKNINRLLSAFNTLLRNELDLNYKVLLKKFII